ncbi:MAG TPA: hypothetical protein VKS20_12370 [Candidatus Acidoferrales bacterium]|nr:hypothetical protein [Candidatus Acidoferrales bacterium]
MRTVLLLGAAICLLTPLAQAQTKISGVAQCAKPTVQHEIQVGDHPGHVFVIDQSKCQWTKPIEIEGIKDKQGTGTNFNDVTPYRSRGQGLYIDEWANGDKTFVQTRSFSRMKDGKLVSGEGTWSFVGGTGKMGKIKAKGTFKFHPNPDGTVTYDIAGEYTPPAK